MPVWRGTLVVPAESKWMIQHVAPDPTSASLRDADPTSGPSVLILRGKSRFAPTESCPGQKPLYKHDADTRAIRDRFWDYGLSGDDGGISRGVAFAFAGGLSGSDS